MIYLDINGLIRFGKFVEFDRVNISCLVDVNNGEVIFKDK